MKCQGTHGDRHAADLPVLVGRSLRKRRAMAKRSKNQRQIVRIDDGDGAAAQSANDQDIARRKRTGLVYRATRPE
ncbi:hypothetical protein CUR86_13750 [Salinicola acroporae]|uniref:Uncharacterized protein n=1 Tax=Salinicola acroporae TaxID=1541440 RepID=A0ABT6I6M6_9GAMM|nr:hypothetical protein [Salinicola acroporae]